MNFGRAKGTVQSAASCGAGLNREDRVRELAAASPRPAVRLSIEHLVVEGLHFENRDSVAFQSALVVQLERLFVQPRILAALKTDLARADVHAGRIQIGSENGPLSVAAQTARAVYGGLIHECRNCG